MQNVLLDIENLKYTKINTRSYSLIHSGSCISYPRTVPVFSV